MRKKYYFAGNNQRWKINDGKISSNTSFGILTKDGTGSLQIEEEKNSTTDQTWSLLPGITSKKFDIFGTLYHQNHFIDLFPWIF